MADLEQIAQQQERYLSLLPEVRVRYGSIPGVDIIGLGAKERGGRDTEEWAWRFYVRIKRPLHNIPLNEQIPAEIFGVQTDVIVHLEHNDLVCDAGSLPANTLINDEAEYRNLGGIFGGAPIRNEYFKSDPNSGYGTLGMFVRRVSDKRLMGLTCAHVVNAAADSMVVEGTHVGQPRYWVSCCCCPKGSIGTVSLAKHYSVPATPNLDCALIEIDNDIRKKAKANVVDDVAGDFPLADTLENKILGHSVMIAGDEAAKKAFVEAHAMTVTGARSVMCFDNVKKRGRGTGLTEGKVVEVAYGTDQMMIKRTGTDADTAPFACHGDSGAMIISSSDSKVLGMVVAGMMETYEEGGVQKKRLTRTIATHIKPIMQALNIKIAGTVIGTVGEPESGGPNGCEIKAWPGGQATTALNPGELFEIDSFFDSGSGGGDWTVNEGAGGALIIEKDDVPLGVPVASVTNASKIRVRYDTASNSSAVNHAVKVKVVRGGIPASKFRTVFSLTPTLNTNAAKDALNSKNFLDSGDAGIVTPDASHTRYLAKAEIIYAISPADLEWGAATTGNISFVTGNPAGSLGNILARRETKFCRGEQGTAAANRTHVDQPSWVSAGDSTADDFQEPSTAVPAKMFRLANKGFNPLIESADINHDTYNPDAYLQRYVRANYRDFLQFYNGPVIGWVTITPQTAWSVNFTGGLSAGAPHVAPPVVSVVAGENVVEAGENTLALPNTQPTLTISGDNPREVRLGETNVTLTAVPVDADNDALTATAPPPPPAATPFVRWTQTNHLDVPIALVANPALPNTSVRFTAPLVEHRYTFSAVTNDSTAGLSRAPAVALPATPNYQSNPATATVDAVEWKNIGGGDPVTARNMTEVFTAASFPLGAATLDFDVTTGNVDAVIIERNGIAIAPTGSVLGAASIRVRYDTRSGDLTRDQTVKIQATNGGGSTWFKRRTVFRITVAVHATDGAPPHTHLIPSALGAAGQDHFCTAQGQGNSVFQATILPAPTPADITWNAGAFAVTVPSVGADRTTAHISSNTGTGQDIPFTVRIGGDICYNGRYWTIWSATGTTPRALALTPHATSFEVGGGFNFTFTIQPAAIITDADRPNLSGGFTAAPPNVTAGDVSVYQSALGFGGGANARWDSTRRARQRVLNPNGVVWRAGVNPDFRTTFLNFPSNPLVGNDDTHTGDPEDNNPYTAPNIGAITGTDFPRDSMADTEGNDGDTVEIRFHCQEFARLEMGGTWYLISPNIDWRIHMLWIKTAGTWGDNGSLVDLTNAGF